MKLGVLTDVQRAELTKLGFTFDSINNANDKGTHETWKFWDDYFNENRHVVFTEVTESTGYGKSQVIKSTVLVQISNRVPAEIYTKVAKVLALANS